MYCPQASKKPVTQKKVHSSVVFCPAYHFYYESWTQSTSMMLKDADEETAKKVLDAFYNAIRHAQK